MLSKRASDIIFIIIVLLVIAGIVFMRSIVLGTMDERIEDLEEENQQIHNEIIGLQGMVSEHRDTEMPSRSELNQYVPDLYERNQLEFFIRAQLEIAGIQDSTERSVSMEVSENPTISGSPYAEAANEFTIVRVGVDIETDDIEEIRDYIDHMYALNQVFVLQNIRYNVPENDGDYVEVTLNFLTFYDLD